MPSKFYSFGKVLSYNAYYNLICGARGLGKTYGAQKKDIRRAIKTTKFFDDSYEVGDQFIYLRRYKEELKLARGSFFDAVAVEFPDMDFKVQGMEALMSPKDMRGDKSRVWAVIGFFCALSQGQTYKGKPFPHVKTIIFDEFILEKGMTHYLPDEAKVFNNFYVTVDRYQERVRVFFLANSVAINNPYFIEWKIDPQQADANGFIKLFNGFMIAHFPDSKDFENEVYATAFGKFINGTEYADYAVGNEFKDAHNGLVKSKPHDAKPLYILETGQGSMGVWYHYKTDEYYIQSKLPGDAPIFTLVASRMSDKKTLVVHNDKPIADLRTAFRHARVNFNHASTRNIFLEVFKR